MTPSGGPEDKINQILARARSDLALAQVALEKEFYNGTSSRAYYAVFHSLKALLLNKGIIVSKHSAVLSAFHREFIKSRIFPDRFGAIVDHLFHDRMLGDYSYDQEISATEAKADLEAASELIQAIETHLRKRGQS